ncbi:radical SAM protein [Limisalsivibrio acetivorans]|uniref:radical SAM protein n=1 Tax=Limisalsivibrio acetivorans TaxID=1304888 RepID=UPI0003B6F8B0|nr:radical SAM protein [Limisalsivibrio acetivorans]
MYEIPNLLFADRQGNIYDHPTLKMTVRSENFNFVPYETELIELPEHSKLFFVPETHPIAYNEETSNMETFTGGSAVSAFLAPGYLRLFLPAMEKQNETLLPLFAYTAVGWLNGKFVVPAIKIDDDSRWNPGLYDFTDNFAPKVHAVLEKYPKNRLYKQLAKCALEYHCTAAKNVFEGRWECPLPVAPSCNSRCIGCISQQPAECCPAPQSRLDFVPSAREIIEIALNHHETAGNAVVSFGQGCEGDPITEAETAAKAIRVIKKKAPGLTVNFNSNCSNPEKMKMILDAGADSIRVSMNSAVHSTYESYYNPVNYEFDDVLKSIELANRYNAYVSLNLLTIPGVNDREGEINTLMDFLDAYSIDLIQMRNLNIDPDFLFSKLKFKTEEILGLKNMLKLIKRKYKNIKFGYFNRTREDFHKDFGYPDLKKRG